MRELIERLEKADGPDRGLDSEVEVATGQAKYRDGKGRACYHDGRRDRVPHYTASIDAAVALVERVLPGWTWTLDSGSSTATLWEQDSAPEHLHQVRGATPSLALCIAILRAKEDRDDR